ncbi:hypothetical protein H3S80_07475 [Bartonella sp. M0177]|nr:hypothetical protein [Bartonella sp. M0177]MBI0003887.1 hypothetical protein [Bartonella sp. M0177]
MSYARQEKTFARCHTASPITPFGASRFCLTPDFTLKLSINPVAALE